MAAATGGGSEVEFGTDALPLDDAAKRRLELELHQAVREGDETKTVFLLKRGVSPSADDGYGSQPLHKAAANGHVAVVGMLLASGALNAPNRSGNTPLHWACQLGHAEVVDALVKHFGDQLDVLSKNKFGRTALTEAMSGEFEGITRVLLAHPSVASELPKPEEAIEDDEDDSAAGSADEDEEAAGGATAGGASGSATTPVGAGTIEDEGPARSGAGSRLADPEAASASRTAAASSPSAGTSSARGS